MYRREVRSVPPGWTGGGTHHRIQRIRTPRDVPQSHVPQQGPSGFNTRAHCGSSRRRHGRAYRNPACGQATATAAMAAINSFNIRLILPESVTSIAAAERSPQLRRAGRRATHIDRDTGDGRRGPTWLAIGDDDGGPGSSGNTSDNSHPYPPRTVTCGRRGCGGSLIRGPLHNRLGSRVLTGQNTWLSHGGLQRHAAHDSRQSVGKRVGARCGKNPA